MSARKATQSRVNITLERGTSCNPDVIRNRSDFRQIFISVFSLERLKSPSLVPRAFGLYVQQMSPPRAPPPPPPPPPPLTKKPEDSVNEIGKVLAHELTVRVDGQIEPTNLCTAAFVSVSEKREYNCILFRK